MASYRINWLEEARADVRKLDRPTAMRILDGVLHYSSTGSGDTKALHGALAGAFRLRLGNYRVLLTFEGDAMRIFGVRHRLQAHR